MSTNSGSTKASFPFAAIAYATLTPLGVVLQGMLQWWCASSIGHSISGPYLIALALFALHTLIAAMVASLPVVARTSPPYEGPKPWGMFKAALAIPILYGGTGCVLIVGLATDFRLADHVAVLAISTFCGLLIHLVGCGLPAILLELKYARENRRYSESS